MCSTKCFPVVDSKSTCSLFIARDIWSDELLKDINISPENFWSGFDKYVHELAPKNKRLIEIREKLQKKINTWHIKNRKKKFNIREYKKFLIEIGYIKKEGPDFNIETENTDEEIASIAGPQLVVPIMNARYTLNAANARWVSLYDSLYGTNIIESDTEVPHDTLQSSLGPSVGFALKWKDLYGNPNISKRLIRIATRC